MEKGTHFEKIFVKKPDSNELVEIQELPMEEYEIFLYGMKMLHEIYWSRKKVFIDENQNDDSSVQTANNIILTSNAAQ